MTESVVAEVVGRVGRAMGEFAMLERGDRVAVGVSGGKDSLCLVHALEMARKRAPFPYDLVAVSLDQGKFTGPIEPLGAALARFGIPWVLRREERTLALVGEGVVHGCDVCSRNRRGGLYALASELGCSVLALGHTADDCAESLLRNVLFNGRIASLPPVAASRKGSIRVIRPLVHVTEEKTALYAEALGLEPIGCVCGEKDGPRREIRAFLEHLAEGHIDTRESVMSALGNVAPYTLQDRGLFKDGADAPEFVASRASRPAER
jgi:tRNA 2-thiocytidine biosynthesis protein TtcA